VQCLSAAPLSRSRGIPSSIPDTATEVDRMSGEIPIPCNIARATSFSVSRRPLGSVQTHMEVAQEYGAVASDSRGRPIVCDVRTPSFPPIACGPCGNIRSGASAVERRTNTHVCCEVLVGIGIVASYTYGSALWDRGRLFFLCPYVDSEQINDRCRTFPGPPKGPPEVCPHVCCC